MRLVSEWQDKFMQDTPATGRKGWGGGDSCASVRTSASTVDFCFADTILCADGSSDRTIPPAAIIYNSIARQTGNGTPVFYWGAGDTSFFTTAFPGASFVWPGRMVVRGGQLHVYGWALSGPLTIIGTTRFKITNPTDAPSSWSITEQSWSNYGGGSYFVSDFYEDTANGYMYIFGYDTDRYPLLARVTLTDYDSNTLSGWTYWNGTTFVSGIGNAGRLWTDEESGTEYSVIYDSTSEKFVALYVTDVFGSSTVRARCASAITGPWSTPVDVVTPEALHYSSDVYCYGPKFHQHITDATYFAGVPFTVNSNSQVYADIVANPRLYFPEWADLDIRADVIRGAEPPTTTPATLEATGAYDTLDTLDADYTTTATTTGGDDKTLSLRMIWPDAEDTTTPRPLVVYCATTDWTASDAIPDPQPALLEDLFVSCGCILAVVGTRVTGDDPLSVGESASMSAYRRAQRAAVLDINTALRYVLSHYSNHTNGVIEPSMVFLAGAKTGGISAMAYTTTFPSRPIAGVIQWSAAFGADSVNGASRTSSLRGDNNYREMYYKTPTCAFLGGADSTIGTTYIESLRTRLATSNLNHVHYDADGGHVAPDGFDVTALTGASTVYQAVANFLSARCRAIVPAATLRKSKATWRKNWYKLESRYW